MKTLTTLIFLGVLQFSLNGQAGIQFYGGVSQASNRDISITPEGQSHSGHHLGVDARLNEGKMFFALGVEYAKLNFMADDSRQYFSVENPMHWIKFRVGLGYTLVDLGDDICIRAKTYGSINTLSNYPDTMEDAPYSNYNSGVAAAVMGLGLDIKAITIDIEYEYGFFNAVNQVKGTEFDFLKLSLGVRI
ncbi:MAG: hypothetical protein HKN09_10110 [Saprospiraceae bacterium]|nr:hypothetical protein [Saprospiraceae bacterium]